MRTYAIVVAAGRSVRLGGSVPKQFRTLCDRPVLAWTLSRFEAASSIDRVVVVVAEDALLYTGQKIVDRYELSKVEKIIVGGETRRESVLNGLKALPISTELVAIHDGARPLVMPVDINRVVDVAAEERAAMLAVPASDTVKRVADDYILATLDRSKLYLAQTPQVFQYDLIMEAHRESEDLAEITDDAALVEARGFKVRVVQPSRVNLKITGAEDLIMAEALLKQEADG